MLIHGNSRFDLGNPAFCSGGEPLRSDKSPSDPSAAASTITGPSSSDGTAPLPSGGETFRIPMHDGHHGHHGHHGVRLRSGDSPQDLLSKLEDVVGSALNPSQTLTDTTTNDQTTSTTTATAELETNPSTVANSPTPSAATAQTTRGAQSATASIAVSQTSVNSFTMISSLSSLANSLKNL